MNEPGFNVPPTTRSYGDGPRFKVSSERPKKRGSDHAIPGLIVQLVIHSTAAAPATRLEGLVCRLCSL